MNTIIGANAAKLAGLQIDILQKLRNGSITLAQLEQFLNLSTDEREMLFSSGKKLGPQVPGRVEDRFAPFLDLGIITVPDDYVHETRLKTFAEQNRKKFRSYDIRITDQNFPNPSRILKPGDKLHVRMFRQVVDTGTSSLDRIAFLETQNAVHTGAQGASLVFEQKCEQLSSCKWYSSLDERDRLWKDDKGARLMPTIFCRSDDGIFDFVLSYFDGVWLGAEVFFCMTEVK